MFKKKSLKLNIIESLKKSLIRLSLSLGFKSNRVFIKETITQPDGASETYITADTEQARMDA